MAERPSVFSAGDGSAARRQRRSPEDERQWLLFVAWCLGWSPHFGQLQALEAWIYAQYLLLICGRRWGKSRFLRWLGCAEALEPQTITWVVAPTYELTKRTYRPIRHALKHILPVAMAARGMRCPRIVRDVDSSSERLLELDNGSLVQAKSAEKPDGLLGEGVTLILPDESARMRSNVFDQYLLATMLDVNGRACLATTPQGYDWNFKLFGKGQPGADYDPQWRSLRSPTWENTALPKGAVLAMARTMSQFSLLQELAAQFNARSGRCFPEFSRETHCWRVPIEPALPVTLCVDFGFRTFAAGGVQDEPSTETTRVFWDAEYHDQTTQQSIDRIKRDCDWWPMIRTIDCDPAGEGTNIQTGKTDVQLLRAAFPKARIRYPKSEEGRSPKRRAQWICDRLMTSTGAQRLFVDYGATNTIRILEESTYPEHKDDQPERDEPLKDGVNDHTRDWLGYHEACEYHRRAVRQVA